MGLTHPALGQELKLTFMDYLLTMLRNLLRRKLGCDNWTTCCGEGMGREFMAGTQHSGVTGGIVRAKLWQCGQTPDIRRIGCELGELAAYPQISLNDPRHTRCRAAPRWIMTGADEKVAGRPSRSSATPLPRRSWKANLTAKTLFHPAEI